MKPDTRTVRELFQSDVRYLVPLYQRSYVWNADRQWQPLWNDVETVLEHRLHGTGNGYSHFLGAIVLEQQLHAPGSIPVFTVIDGQQRLTTLQLIVGAASTVAADVGADKEAAILRKLTNNDPLMADGIERFKIWPTNADRAAFQAVMSADSAAVERDDDASSRIDEAYKFFCTVMTKWVNEADGNRSPIERMTDLRIVLSDLLKLVSITLEPGDNAQIIFETLNARGTPLLALDLVKNAVFHAAVNQGVDADPLYHEVWKPELDQKYWRTERRQGRLNRPRADLFLMHWLAMKLREVIPATELFASFRERILKAQASPPARELIRELRNDAKIMRSFDNQPPGSYEATFFERLDILDTSIVTPLVLLLFRDSRIPAPRRRRALQILESWLVRRALMRLTVKNYNQQIPAMLNGVAGDPEHADEALLAHLRSRFAHISRWPTDEEFKAYLTTRSLYGHVAAKRLVMALAAVEQSMYSSKVDLPFVPSNLSLEHVLPQAWEQHWPLPAGADPVEAGRRRQDRIHRLGNLTLTTAPLNAALSNAAWPVKRTALNKSSKLLLNTELIDMFEAGFDEDSIDRRGELLADRVCAVWPGPTAWTQL
jgi:hypothetical protein